MESALDGMNAVITRGLPVPLPIIPLAGGTGGLVFAILFGWISTKRSGTAFAMITLGLAELVGSSALILRSFFGGEEGVRDMTDALNASTGLAPGPAAIVAHSAVPDRNTSGSTINTSAAVSHLP
jgi:branched-chain amino acid transport system permease protein